MHVNLLSHLESSCLLFEEPATAVPRADRAPLSLLIDESDEQVMGPDSTPHTVRVENLDFALRSISKRTAFYGERLWPRKVNSQ